MQKLVLVPEQLYQQLVASRGIQAATANSASFLDNPAVPADVKNVEYTKLVRERKRKALDDEGNRLRDTRWVPHRQPPVDAAPKVGSVSVQVNIPKKSRKREKNKSTSESGGDSAPDFSSLIPHIAKKRKRKFNPELVNKIVKENKKQSKESKEQSGKGSAFKVTLW